MSIKSTFSKLTGLGRLVVIVLVVGLLGAGIFFGAKSKGINLGGLAGGDGKYDAYVLVDTYTGWGPFVAFNGGKDGSKESEFYKRFNLRLKIIQMDDFDGATAYFKEHKNAIRFCTLDSYPVEASQSGTMTDARYFMIHNFSAGADAIVATKNIKRVADLKGKKIVCSEGTASHSLLLNTLAANGLSNSDVQIITTGYGADVATAFKAGTADAAVVFCPDDDACIKDGPAGTHVLVSTKDIQTLVTDGFLAHEEWLKDNPETAKKIVEALLWANSEMNNNPETYKEVCHVFAQEFDVPEEDVLTVGSKINFATLEDNINWFGLNTEYDEITGEKLYTKMSQVYGEIGLAKTTMPWRTISETSIIESLMKSNNLTNDQTANGTAKRKFSAPSMEVKSTEAFSDKEVIIEFPVDGSALSVDAETIIEREMLPIIKQFNNCYVRIEGNTDNTGSYQHNIELSKQRAQSVANYLNRQGVDRNRFIVEGNGPKRAISDGVVGSNQSYRTTSMKLVQR